MGIPFASCKNKNLKYFKYYKLFLKIFYFYYCNKNLYNKIFSVICFYKYKFIIFYLIKLNFFKKNNFFKEKFKELILNLINKSYKDKNKNFYLSFLKFITFKFLIIIYLKNIFISNKNYLIKL